MHEKSDTSAFAGAATVTRGVDPHRSVARSFDRRQIVARQTLPLGVLALLVWFGWDKLAALDTVQIVDVLKAVGPTQWLTGLVFTGVSFWAVGRYDSVVHRITGTGIGARDAVETGASAIAIAQIIGMGTITGAFVRWRLLPGLGFTGAMKVSLIVSLSFLAAWAVLAAAALLAVPLPLPLAPWLIQLSASVVLLTASFAAACGVLRPRFLPSRLTRAVPSLKAMTIVLGLAALDTLAAGTLLWILLPDIAGLGAPTVLAAYLLALGAGLVLTTPGGIGPFEAALFALLPQVDAETLLAAIIAYRALYYGLPAIIAGVVMVRGPRQARAHATGASTPALMSLATAPNLPFLIDAVIDHAPRAEAALLRHGRMSLATDHAGRPVAMVAPTGQSLVMLSDPLRPGADPGDTLTCLSALAQSGLRAPVLYKAGARLAASARARGWLVTAVAREAWLDPRSFTTEGKRRAGLRRKLRKAEAAGVKISAVPPTCPDKLPRREMAAIAAQWAATHGGERGFSMGQWAPETLDWAHVVLARGPTGALLGFVTLHANAGEQTLDLIRTTDTAPDGLTYLLLTRAIEAAGQAGLARISLAAVPVAPGPADAAPLRALRNRLETASGAGGLRQFKAAFAPNWETLYIAAPSLAALGAGALDIAREITRDARS